MDGAAHGRPAGAYPHGPVRSSKGKRLQALIAAIVADERLTCPQAMVLVVIARRLGWTKKPGRPAGTCNPAINTIARDAKLKRRATCAAIKALASPPLRWLVVEHESLAAGHRTSSRYRVVPPSASP
jgi:hypothetical protein